jgi:hypothetical protein
MDNKGFILASFCSSLMLSGDAAANFVFPDAFNGLWIGYPEKHILGPYEYNYTFSISPVANGDSIMEANLVIDQFLLGWQRFYIEGISDSPGEIWYCGRFANYSEGTELAGAHYPDAFKLQSQSDTSITWCLDTDDPDVSNRGYASPFPITDEDGGCELCDCANWTISLKANDTVPGGNILNSVMTTAGSTHLYVDMILSGDAPYIDDSDWPEHGSNFTCDFDGRDSTPIDFSSSSSSSSDTTKNDEEIKEEQELVTKVIKQQSGHNVGCPYMNNNKHHKHDEKSSENSFLPYNDEYEFCYVLNAYSEFQLQWKLREEDGMLDIQISGSTPSDLYYVAIGFRPMSRSEKSNLIELDTGRNNNFGMIGADIVAGFGNGVVQTMYADKYTGPPEADTSLDIYNESSFFVPWDESDPTGGGTTTLKFTRPIAKTGKLYSLGYPLYSNILDNPFADIIWSIGSMSSSNEEMSCAYHINTRGLRMVDWREPDNVFVELWKC